MQIRIRRLFGRARWKAFIGATSWWCTWGGPIDSEKPKPYCNAAGSSMINGRLLVASLTRRNFSNFAVAKMKPRIGGLTSGGDCPGLNAVLRAVVLAADKLGWEVVGFRDGFEGLLPPGNHVILDRQAVNGIMALGGTILGTTNRGHFAAKVGAGDRTIVPPNIIAGARQILEELCVRALIVVGGDGSLAPAQQLQESGIDCIGVPKTIDNDLEATAITFGFDSAVNVVV